MSELNLPKRFKGFALPVVTTDGNTVIKTALLSDIIQALSDERTQNNLKTSRILELETDLLQARADSDKRNAVVEAAKTILTQRHTTMREYVVDRNALGETLVALEGDIDA